jgi:hypothetical protein
MERNISAITETAVSPGEESEYGRLYGAYCLAINDSYNKLLLYGMSSREFQEANTRVNALWAGMQKFESFMPTLDDA